MEENIKIEKNDLDIIKHITSNDVMIVNFSEQIEPQYKIVRSKDYVIWGESEQNNWGQYLRELMNRCPVHSSILSTKIKMTHGGGLYLLNEKELTPEQISTVKDFLFKQNNFNQVLRRVAYDYQLYGHFAIRIGESLNAKFKTGIRHIDAGRIFSGKYINKEIEYYYYSNDWADTRNNPIEPIPAWSPDNDDDEQIMFVKDYQSGIEGMYYGREKYRAGINAINASYHIINLHLNNLKKGMTPTVVISFKGECSDEEKQILYKKMQNLYAGSDNAGKFIMTFNGDGVTIQPISVTDIDKLYDTLLEQILQMEMVAHSVTSPLLFGIKTSGQMGGRNELVEANEAFHSNIISSDQELIISAFQDILSANDMDYVELGIKRYVPVKFLFSDPNTINRMYSINDLRRIAQEPEIDRPFANLLQGEAEPEQTKFTTPNTDNQIKQ